MESPEELINQFAKQVPGRCHSCNNCQTFELPDEPRHWCRAFGVIIDDQKRSKIRNCPRWQPFKPGRDLSNKDPLLRDIVEQEDQFLATVKASLKRQGLCLRTLMALAYPSLDPRGQQLDWIDRLEMRFPTVAIYELEELNHLLRANGYHDLTVVIAQALSGKNNVEHRTKDQV
jgi:hypothetical protein